MDILFLFIGILIGAVATWLIRKYAVESNFISKSELDAKQATLAQTEQQLGLTTARLQEAQQQLSTLQT